MDREELRSEIASLLSDSLGEFKELFSSLSAEVGSVRESVQGIDSEITALRADSEKNEAATKESRIDNELEKLVRKGRMTPAERPSEKKMLLKLSDEDIAERLEDLNQRSPILSERLTDTQISESDGPDASQVDASRYISQTGGAVDQKSLGVLKEAMARSGGDFNAMRRAAYALHGEDPGGTN